MNNKYALFMLLALGMQQALPNQVIDSVKNQITSAGDFLNQHPAVLIPLAVSGLILWGATLNYRADKYYTKENDREMFDQFVEVDNTLAKIIDSEKHPLLVEPLRFGYYVLFCTKSLGNAAFKMTKAVTLTGLAVGAYALAVTGVEKTITVASNAVN